MDASGNLPGSVKLTYLRSYLTDYAYRIISHLSISDDNYEVAVKLLKDEFLDLDYINDEYLKQLCENFPKHDSGFVSVRQYLNETRAILYELKTYGVDFLATDTAGCKLLSHIIFSKLPNAIKRELVHKVGTNFPSIVHLFDHYNDIIKTLVRTSYKRENNNDKSHFTKQSLHYKSGNQSEIKKNRPVSTLENFKTNAENASNHKYCKFCNEFSHSMFTCSRFSTHESRLTRCKEFKLCHILMQR